MPDLRLVESPIGDVGKRPKARSPRRPKTIREAAKNARKTMQADARVDAELSRAIDAIGFLSRNEIDPAPLIARISPMEAEAVTANLQKAVEWLS